MALSLSHYRFGKVELAENTHGWLAGEDRGVTRLPGVSGQFLLRCCVQADLLGLNNVDFEWQYRLNGGAWTNITTASSVARTGSTTVFTNGQNCTKRLSGTGTFEASAAGCTHDGTTGGAVNDIVSLGNSETEIGLQIISADTVVGDLVEFRLTRDGGTLLDAYDVVPSLRVATEIMPIQSRDASVHTSLSAGVNKIRNTLVEVEAIGMSSADLADDTLTMTMNVKGTTVVGSTDPADYTAHLYGPDVWSGGLTGKDGLPVEPGFGFSQDIPEGVRRVLATFEPGRTVTFGAQATLVE